MFSWLLAIQLLLSIITTLYIEDESEENIATISNLMSEFIQKIKEYDESINEETRNKNK